MKWNLFKDILKVKVEGSRLKFSQGRVYLFAFIVCYIATLAYYMFKTDSMTTIIDSIQWAILLFAAYVFGGKGVNIAKNVFNKKDNSSSTPPTNTPTTNAVNDEPQADVPAEKKEEDLCT